MKVCPICYGLNCVKKNMSAWYHIDLDGNPDETRRTDFEPGDPALWCENCEQHIDELEEAPEAFCAVEYRWSPELGGRESGVFAINTRDVCALCREEPPDLFRVAKGIFRNRDSEGIKCLLGSEDVECLLDASDNNLTTLPLICAYPIDLGSTWVHDRCARDEFQ